MTTNPYESPRGIENEKPSDGPAREKGLGSIAALIFATIAGGLAGVIVGNFIVLSLGLLLPMFSWNNTSIFGIKHPLSLVFLVLGSFVGAYATNSKYRPQSHCP